MEPNVLDRMLQTYLTEGKTVTLTLQNKVRVTGKVAAFDSYVLVIEGQKQEIIYRHAVSSLSLQGVPDQRPAASPRPASPSPRRRTAPSEKHRTASAPLSLSGKENGISNTMKEGLLKWMEGQKAK